MLMPPAEDAIKTTFCEARSITAPKIEFFLNLAGFFNINAINGLAFFIGLEGD